VKFKLDENLPVSSAAILTSVGHDVDTVTDEGLVGAPDRDVVATATAAARILISLDRLHVVRERPWLSTLNPTIGCCPISDGMAAAMWASSPPPPIIARPRVRELSL
jgi:hypothetical protein